MADYVKGIQTEDGVKQIDYNALANKPQGFKRVINRSLGADVNYIDITEDDEGNPLSFEEAYVRFTCCTTAESNQNFNIGFIPWRSSYNSRSVYAMTAYKSREFYTYVVHFKKLYDGVILGEYVYKGRIGVVAEGTAITPASLSLWSSPTSEFQKCYFVSNNNLFGTSLNLNADGKMQCITIGGDLATSVTLSADSLVEVFAK